MINNNHFRYLNHVLAALVLLGSTAVAFATAIPDKPGGGCTPSSCGSGNNDNCDKNNKDCKKKCNKRCRKSKNKAKCKRNCKKKCKKGNDCGGGGSGGNNNGCPETGGDPVLLFDGAATDSASDLFVPGLLGAGLRTARTAAITRVLATRFRAIAGPPVISLVTSSRSLLVRFVTT